MSPRLRLAWRAIDRRLLDAVGSALLFALMAADLAGKPLETGARPTTPVAYVLALAIAAPFAWHRRHPTAAVVTCGLAVLAYSVGHFNAYPGYALFAIVFADRLHSRRRSSILVPAVAAVALGVALRLQPSGVVDVMTWVTTALTLAVAWLAGETLRARRARWAELEERARRLEREREERARQAVTVERLRIARELHDVVAHAMSVIAVQAGVANHLLDERPELARPALSTVESAARSALVEMRRLLGVLRQPGDPTEPLVATPGLAELPALVAQFERAGLTVRVTVVGQTSELPDGIDLSAYRIVQEGLTNVLRHGGPVAELTLTCLGTGAAVEIRDDGRPNPPSSTADGHGLIGIRERVAVFGGEFVAQREAGGFRLRATLPAGGAA
jgi:signal transduction histidine kinase